MFQIKKLAFQKDLSSLKEECDEFIFGNFNEVASSEEFLNLDFQEVLNLISSEELCAPQEQKVKSFILLKRHQ